MVIKHEQYQTIIVISEKVAYVCKFITLEKKPHHSDHEIISKGSTYNSDLQHVLGTLATPSNPSLCARNMWPVDTIGFGDIQC